VSRPGAGRSIARRLFRVSYLSSIAALLSATVAFAVYDVHESRRTLERRLATDARIIGSNTVAALLFDDEPSASATLAALRAEPYVVAAGILQPGGRLFAAYSRDGGAVVAPALQDAGHRYGEDGLTLVHPIVLDGAAVGTVFIRSELHEVTERIARYAGVAALVFLGSLLTALLIAARAQRAIVVPIRDLAETAGMVSARKDYAVRAAVEGEGELRQLVDTFNEMLAQIQARDDELRAARDGLEQRVQERTEELSALNSELEAFTYSVSHDLRAPLRHIHGFVDLLQRRAADTLDDTSRRYLETIASAAKKMGQLVDDLLAFSRMGRVELRRGRVSLQPVVEDVIRELREHEPGRAVVFQTAPDLPEVAGDAATLRVVLSNLISNALKYTRTRERAEIQIGTLPANGADEAVMYVRDNGVGFDMQYADKLFGVFQRLHRSDEFEGTGIGLATVRRIVHRHGGRAWAEAVPDVGATFYVSLPRPARDGEGARG
jgi:signal transduction histidine kinase